MMFAPDSTNLMAPLSVRSLGIMSATCAEKHLYVEFTERDR